MERFLNSTSLTLNMFTTCRARAKSASPLSLIFVLNLSMQSSITYTIFVIISHFHHLMPGLPSFVSVFQIKAFLSVFVINELGALTANFKVEFDINKKCLKSLFQSDTYVFKIGANSQRLAYSPVLLSN